MAVQRLSRRSLGRATLARQLLLEREAVPVSEAVERLAGLQAQAIYSPYYQLWSRLTEFDAAELGGGLLDHSLVRLVVMRGTIHLMTARDAAFLRRLTQPIMTRDIRTNSIHGKNLDGIDLELVAETARSLLAGAPLTVPELTAALALRFPDRVPASLAHAARNLLPIVQVPPRAVWGSAGAVRLQTLDTWAPADEEQQGRGIDTLVLRYLAAFGPASAMDVQSWSGLTRLREVLDTLRPRLEVFQSDNGGELFDLPDAPRPVEDTKAPARFLPDFDNVLRGHTDRTRIISDEHRAWINRSNGVAPHFVLVDGEFAGTWSIDATKDAAVLTIEPAEGFTAAQKGELESEGERLLAFANPGLDGDIRFDRLSER